MPPSARNNPAPIARVASGRPAPPPAPALERVYCPECGHDLTKLYDPPKKEGEFAVCPRCAAIFVMAKEGYFRLLVTEEWWTLMISPKYHDLMEARVSVLERLTAPAAR